MLAVINVVVAPGPLAERAQDGIMEAQRHGIFGWEPGGAVAAMPFASSAHGSMEATLQPSLVIMRRLFALG
jgi:hypothetical protein